MIQGGELSPPCFHLDNIKCLEILEAQMKYIEFHIYKWYIVCIKPIYLKQRPLFVDTT